MWWGDPWDRLGQAGVRFDAVIVGARLEVERWVILVKEQRIAHGPPLVPEGHGGEVEERARNPLGEEDGEEADQHEDTADRTQRVGDDQLGDGEQPLHRRPPAGGVRLAMELQLRRIGHGDGYDRTSLGSYTMW